MVPFTHSDRARLETQLDHSEGFRLKAYRCTSGRLSIGRGHNCDASPVPGVSKVGDSITREQAEALFQADLDMAIANVRQTLPWVTELSAARQAVLYDMAFNMGVGNSKRGLLSFRNTLKYIEFGDYEKAASNMMMSAWAYQVGDGPGGRFDRAERLARQMETGAWQ
ncbi:glycoside hydrolase family protein [Desulfovibrio sp. OttesenSCG-928-G11]|nr:glycoside hydrolase family protein [Desulfovibrio sp. OttesenSCG-928-G11]